MRSIAAKDLHQAIHNKLIVSILLGTVLLVAGNAVLIRLIGAAAGSPTDLAAASSPVLAMMISITLFTLGVTLVPLLMLEEKEAHTLETLLVSPARYLQIVAGKALAGTIYCLSGLLVIVIAYRFLIIHWELALLAVLAGTAFVVALGLLVGIVSNNPTTVGLWSTTILLILIVPTLLSGLSSFTRAPWLEALIDYWPSTATYKLLTLAMTVEIPKGMVIGNAAIVISAAILLYMLTWWLVRRSDQ